MSALPSGERPAPLPFPPAQPDSLTRVFCSLAVTCHILPTLPGAWPALCKTTCARCVRPRCDAPAPHPSEMQASGALGRRAGAAKLPPVATPSWPPACIPPCGARAPGPASSQARVSRGASSRVDGDRQAGRCSRHVEIAAFVVPKRATPAAWYARLRVWAAPCTLEARFSRSDSSGSLQCGRERVPTSLMSRASYQSLSPLRLAERV